MRFGRDDSESSPEAARISWLSLILLGRFMHPGGEQERKGR